MLNLYDRSRDPEDHVDYFKLMLRFQNAKDEVKCKIFPLTFTKEALAWNNTPRTNLITSWYQFTELFKANFTASQVKPKSEKTLNNIWQREGETIREYIERFNAEALNVHGLEDK